jgi:hypothetical protein
MRKRTTLASGLAAAVVGLTLTVAPTASATTVRPADTAGYFTLCSDGGYTSVVSWVDRGNRSVLAPAGTCFTIYMGGTYNEQINVYDDVNGTFYYIGSTIYNGLVGETLVTVGGPSFYVE